jgi:hypothetical protein
LANLFSQENGRVEIERGCSGFARIRKIRSALSRRIRVIRVALLQIREADRPLLLRRGRLCIERQQSFEQLPVRAVLQPHDAFLAAGGDDGSVRAVCYFRNLVRFVMLNLLGNLPPE